MMNREVNGIMQQGIVKWFNKTKGYGFISSADGQEDIFFHATVLEKAGLTKVEENQQIYYEVEIKDGRLRAAQISLTPMVSAA